MADQKGRGADAFQTGNRLQPAGAPPLCTTNFVSIDQGNSRPQFIRSSVYSLPVSKDMCNTSRLPIVLAVQPFAPVESQEVSLSSHSILLLVFTSTNMFLKKLWLSEPHSIGRLLSHSHSNPLQQVQSLHVSSNDVCRWRPKVWVSPLWVCERCPRAIFLSFGPDWSSHGHLPKAWAVCWLIWVHGPCRILQKWNCTEGTSLYFHDWCFSVGNTIWRGVSIMQ